MQFLFIYKPRLLPLGIWLVMCGPPLISLTAKLQVVRLGVRGAPSFAQGTCFLRDWHSGHNYSNPHWRRVESNAVPLGCPIKRAERLLSEERDRLLMEQIRQLIAAAPQGESFQLPWSHG